MNIHYKKYIESSFSWIKKHPDFPLYIVLPFYAFARESITDFANEKKFSWKKESALFTYGVVGLATKGPAILTTILLLNLNFSISK